ncbi:MAG: hypothetical protein J0L72_00955 [Armatimonadetes bacterium]|nr:hypothetical protein [Armatimonadota bacterium]
MTTIELLIWMTKDGLDKAISATKAMPEERQSWKPLDSGRTAINQLAECLQVAEWFARIIREKNANFFTPEFFKLEHELREQISLPHVLGNIEIAYESLYAAMRDLKEEDYTFEVSLRPGLKVPLLHICYFPLRNLYYHFGQINYIQTLYGDYDSH